MPDCDHLPIWSEEYLICYSRFYCENGDHYVGSARMGDVKDSMTVVDDRLRVRGVTGVRVADASVIPTIIRGDTQAETMVIGKKAADLIKSDWKHKDNLDR